MKALKMLSTSALLIGSAVFFSGCKKDNDNDGPKQTCRIITATPSPSGDSYNFTYNGEGKLATASIGTQMTTFSYSGNTVVQDITSGGVFSGKRIVTNNANGMAINIRTENNVGGTDWNNQAIEYSGIEIIKVTSTDDGGGAPSIQTFTWSNGNMMSANVAGVPVTTLDYYTDKPQQDGDYLSLAQKAAGYEVYRTKNMLKSLFSGSSITSFTYTFAGDGKTESVTSSSGGTVSTLTYQYQCN